jgi:D-alanyl-D-alanine carboxypeptidase
VTRVHGRPHASPSVGVVTYALLFAACSAGSRTETGNAAGPDSVMVAAIDSIASAALVNGPIAGLSIAVAHDDALILSKGYGLADLENATAATDHTVYDIASITKLLTATAVMRLAHDERLSLDDDLATLLAAFPNREQGRRITLRHLLSHTSGLHDYEAADSERWLELGTPLTQDFVIDFIRDRPLDFEPGSHWSYSNTGYYLLALVIEQITGDYGRYMREQIAMPLDMQMTRPCEESPLATRTRGYDVAGDRLVPGRFHAMRNILGDGGMCSTVIDLVRLPAALRRAAFLGDVAFNRMLEPTVLDNGVSVDYGLGVRRGVLESRPLWGHTGGMTSYWAALVDYPVDGVTIAVLVNTDAAAVDALTIESDVARVVLGFDDTLQDRALSADEIQDFSGSYDDGSVRVLISTDGGRLLRATEGSARPPQQLLYQGGRAFAWRAYPLDRFVFHAAAGETVGMAEYYNGVFATYRRAVAHD